MPRGARKDVPATLMLIRNKFFKCRSSFVGYRVDTGPMLFLAGEDRTEQREKVFQRDKGKCRKCGREVDRENGEMHHVIARGKGGSDDLSNLEWRCGRFIGDCHTSEHVQTRFTPGLNKLREEAKRDFEKLYEEKTDGN